MSELRSIIQDILATTNLADPREIAAEVLNRIPRGGLKSALREALPTYVTVTLSRGRLVSPDAAYVPGDMVPSAKVARVRTAWQERLATPLLVGKVWKPLAACTVADLDVVVADLRGAAKRTLAKADYYQRVQSALVGMGPNATVGMLTADPTAVAA